MAIPKTRDELLDQVESESAKLSKQLDEGGSAIEDLVCADEWTVKDLLAIRVWWSEAVVGWVRAGRMGRAPELPAPGFKWSDTPDLNAGLVAAARGEAYDSVRRRLLRAVKSVRETIDSLDDEELLEVGRFEWAGKWPVARWISINSARQYRTARDAIRRATRPVGE